jgi:hypothetical protein
MNDFPFPQISGTQGPVHGGEGPQNNNFFALPPDPKGRSPRKQAADDLDDLDRRFVYPGGFGDAREKLELHRTVFLHGQTGIGRTAAAKVLLRERLSGDQTIHPGRRLRRGRVGRFPRTGFQHWRGTDAVGLSADLLPGT